MSFKFLFLSDSKSYRFSFVKFTIKATLSLYTNIVAVFCLSLYSWRWWHHMKELCTCSYVLLFRCYLDSVHQHHDSDYRMMKWFRLHCWYSLLGTARSRCRKHSRVVLPQYHGQSRHFQMEWLLWHVVADMRTLLFWRNIQPTIIFMVWFIKASKVLPSTGYPNCLQTTPASRLSQELSQTVPHKPLRQISTVPALTPPLNRIWPSLQLVGTAST